MKEITPPSWDYRNGLGSGMDGPVGPDIRMNRIFWLPKLFSVLIERFKLIFGPVDSECQIRLNRFPIPFESLTGSFGPFDWIKNLEMNFDTHRTAVGLAQQNNEVEKFEPNLEKFCFNTTVQLLTFQLLDDFQLQWPTPCWKHWS